MNNAHLGNKIAATNTTSVSPDDVTNLKRRQSFLYPSRLRHLLNAPRINGSQEDDDEFAFQIYIEICQASWFFKKIVLGWDQNFASSPRMSIMLLLHRYHLLQDDGPSKQLCTQVLHCENPDSAFLALDQLEQEEMLSDPRMSEQLIKIILSASKPMEQAKALIQLKHQHNWITEIKINLHCVPSLPALAKSLENNRLEDLIPLDDFAEQIQRLCCSVFPVEWVKVFKILNELGLYEISRIRKNLLQHRILGHSSLRVLYFVLQLMVAHHFINKNNAIEKLMHIPEDTYKLYHAHQSLLELDNNGILTAKNCFKVLSNESPDAVSNILNCILSRKLLNPAEVQRIFNIITEPSFTLFDKAHLAVKHINKQKIVSTQLRTKLTELLFSDLEHYITPVLLPLWDNIPHAHLTDAWFKTFPRHVEPWQADLIKNHLILGSAEPMKSFNSDDPESDMALPQTSCTAT